MKIKCPNCFVNAKLKVLETRTPNSKLETMRRRRCESCGFTFWTTEATHKKIKMEVQPAQPKSPSTVSVKLEIKDLPSASAPYAIEEIRDSIESILEKYTV